MARRRAPASRASSSKDEPDQDTGILLPPSNREVLAYHEAGHAVVAQRRGFGLTGVYLYDHGGRTTVRNPRFLPYRELQTWEKEPSRRAEITQRVEDEVVFSFAGYAATEHFRGIQARHPGFSGSPCLVRWSG